MDITKEVVNKWLETERRSQTWLAEQCGVTVQNASNWLADGSNREIPVKHQITIAALMAEDAAASEAKPPHNLVLEFLDEEYSCIENKALSELKTIREWAKDMLLEIANENIEALAATLKTSRFLNQNHIIHIT